MVRPFTSVRAVSLQGLSLASLQLFGWGLYALGYYLTLRPYQPFGDILWKQTLVATSTGLLVSSLLGTLYWSLALRQRAPAVQILLVLGAGLAAGLIWYQIKAWGVDWVNPFIAPVTGVASFRPGEGSFLSGAVSFPIVMIAWSGVYLGFAQWSLQQKQERRLLRADAEAQRARLRALRYQLNPHFFFNALNTIEALASEKPERVREVVRELSGFLRYTLLDEEALKAPLQQEVKAIEHYLAVEKIRFEDDLQVNVDVTPEAGRSRIPSFLVLPLVENAVKHGQRTSPMPLRIHVTASIERDTLALEVANTGRWRAEAPDADGTNTGLDNVRTRLETQYPDHYRFEVAEENGWVRAQIEIDTKALTSHE